MRVFIDANVLIAGAASRGGASRAILMLGEIGLLRLVVSRQILDEAERNLRRKLPQGLPIFAELLAAIPLEIVADPAEDQVFRWLDIIEAKDAPLIAAALLAEIDRFITLNTRDFTTAVAEKSGLSIQTPAELMEDLRRMLREKVKS